MRVIRHVREANTGRQSCIVAVGWFDGVHLGHRAVLHRSVELAQAHDAVAVAVNLVPPRRADSGAVDAPFLCGLRQCVQHIGRIGVDVLLLRNDHSVDGMAALIEQLSAGLRISRVVLGGCFNLRRRWAESIEILDRFGTTRGFGIDLIGPVAVDGGPITSSAIAGCVDRGNLDAVAVMLGRPYDIWGRVVHGYHRGRKLGFPTANLHMTRTRLPADGVYAVRVGVADDPIAGIANVGFNPTFGIHRRTMEVHLFDFEADLYGRRLEVSFISRLRGERKFPNAAALVKQIREDAARARVILGRT